MKVNDTKDYTYTLNLPKKTIPVDGKLSQRQSYFLDKMQDDNRYKQAIIKNKGSKIRYKLTSFPISINETLTPTIAVNKIYKDIFSRYETIQGKIVEDNLVFSDEGLEVDFDDQEDNAKKQEKIEEGLKKKAEEKKKQFEILKNEIIEINSLGTMMNFSNSYYSTADDDVEASIIDNFLKMFQEGKIHREFRPVNWCPRCKSAISHNDVKYINRDVYSYYILYHMVKDDKNVIKKYTKDDNVYFIATTIFPWTMMASKCIALAKEEKYSIVLVELENKKNYYILAKEFVKKFMDYKNFLKYKEIAVLDAEEFINIKCENPLDYTKYIDIVCSTKDKVYADKDHTSGIRIVSLGHTYIDYLINNELRNYHLQCVVDENGVTNSLAIVYNNTLYMEANKKIKQFLKQYNFIYYSETIKASIGYCRKCNTRLLYRCINEWYLDRQEKITPKLQEKLISKISANSKYLKEELPAQIEKINQKEQIVISDNKEIGIPIPVFYCAECGSVVASEKVNLLLSEMFKKNTNDFWYKLSADEILKGETGCQKCGCAFLFKDEGNLNSFFKDLSVEFYDDFGDTKNICIINKDMFHKKLLQLCFSGKLSEAIEKIDKFMIYSNIEDVKDKLLNEKFKKVQQVKQNKAEDTKKDGFKLLNAKWKKENGEKENKSTNANINLEVDSKKEKMKFKMEQEEMLTKTVMKNYGTDILRLWAVSKAQDNSIKLNKQFMINTNKTYKNIRRTFKYLLSNLTDFNPTQDLVSIEKRLDLDRYYYKKLYDMEIIVKEAYDKLDYKKVYDCLVKFCNELVLKYFDCIKYKLYILKQKSNERRSIQSTMYDILMKLAIYFEPIIPFTLEEVWPYIWHTSDGDSKNNILTYRDEVTLVDIDVTNEKEKWEKIFKLKEEVRKKLSLARNDKIISDRLEASVTITTDKDMADFIEKYYDDILQAFNVSRIFVNISNSKKDIKISKKEGVACARCKHLSIYIGKDLKYLHLCPNCAKILEGK